MPTSLVVLFILWSAIASVYFVCNSIPRLTLGNGTVLSDKKKVKVEYGNPLELLCTGNAVSLHILTKNFLGLVNTSTVNETTVRFFEENPKRQISLYICIDSHSNSEIGVSVTVDSPPSLSDFRCKSKNLQYLNCTWTSLNMAPTFSLYYIEINPYTYTFFSSIICKIRGDDSLYCVWDNKNPWKPYHWFENKLTFMIKLCNDIGCANQTFVFDHEAIIRPDPPQLTLLQKTSQSAVFSWGITPEVETMTNIMELKISYWYSGFHQSQLETATIPHIFELKLPCAGIFYEVRLSIRPKAAKGEEFWSEDAVITFETDPDRANLTAVDTTCTRPRPRVPITSEVIQYVIEQFRDKMEKEQNELEERIRLLKRRVEEKHTHTVTPIQT